MKELSISELKTYQIKLLSIVNDFCNKNKIKYWLTCGTLLGAVRHKGYIPWDDDLDIGMLREDYEKFLALFNDSYSRYRVKSIENDNAFPYPYAKILDLKTVLYEPDYNGNKLSVNIDLFVYDIAPNDQKSTIKLYKKRDRLRRLHNIRNNKIRRNNI